MNVLSVVHGLDVRTELFAPVIADAGHRLDEWSFAWNSAPPMPLDAYDAVLVFGGVMHADQDAWHPWLRDEAAWLQELLESGTPTLGICLGAQLLARATGAWVGPMPEPEIGFVEVELNDAGAADPVLGVFPRRFDALQWHYYTYAVPEGAVELARSSACTQAFRLGDSCWALQFHPEATAPQIAGWIDDGSDPPPDPERLRRDVDEKIERWNELGRAVCGAFLEVAEQLTSGIRAA